MYFEPQPNTQQQTETIKVDINSKEITPTSKDPNYEAILHSPQIKRLFVHFDDISPNILDSHNLKQSYNPVLSGVSKNFLNLLNYNKTAQQEKYDCLKNYCLKKNDENNYPLISYENYLSVDGLFESDGPEYIIYKNLLLNKIVPIELIYKFCILLMNRYVLSKEKKTIKRYPKVVYQFIFDINNIHNYLGPDIVADAKQSNMFVAIILYQNKWNVLAINQNSNYCNYFIFNKNIDKTIIITLMDTISQTIYPNNKFQFTVSDYSEYKEDNQIILPFIIMDFLARYNNQMPTDDADFYYQTILILSEIMTNNLITK